MNTTENINKGQNPDRCPFCGAEHDPFYMLKSWECETTKDNQGIYQSMPCIQRQRDQLQTRLREAKSLLREVQMYRNFQAGQKHQMHSQIGDFLSAQEPLDPKIIQLVDKNFWELIDGQEPLGKEFEQVLHDNMDELRVKT
jgi:hypothetical protein